MALGIVFSGFSASAAAMPMSSIPPNANIKKASMKNKPSKPFGKKPPCAHRLLNDAVESSPAVKSKNRPNTIIATTAVTLMIDSQNSDSP